jgi:NitT/TauT family transport system ATP-binding protein
MRRLDVCPLRWLLLMLQVADTHQLEKDVLTTALELDFPAEEAARLVEVAINWGRYAELLAYNDRTARIDLENHTAAEPPHS